MIVPNQHTKVSQQVAATLEELFRTENVTSLSDFG